MPEKKLLLFDEPGKANTDATLAACVERAGALDIHQVVVATTTGATALAAKRAMQDSKVVGVTLQAGLWQKYAGPDPKIIEEAESAGVLFLTATHSLMGNVGSAIREKLGGICPVEVKW